MKLPDFIYFKLPFWVHRLCNTKFYRLVMLRARGDRIFHGSPLMDILRRKK